MTINEVVLSIKDLEKHYGVKNVLKGINLTVYRGQIIGYIGPNGAGKSTTIKILLGLEGDYYGKVEIFGEEVTETNIDYKRKIGYVPEIADLYDNLTAMEYLTFVGELYGMDFQAVDEKAQRLMKVLA